MKTSNTQTIKKTFQKIADIVTPTMGAKGRMAIINDEFGNPIYENTMQWAILKKEWTNR